jgi:lambda repressor-like predicted transcriptional regulator
MPDKLAQMKETFSIAAAREMQASIRTGRGRIAGRRRSTVQEAVEKAELKAEKQVAKELDVNPGDVDAAIQEAAGEVS